MLCSDRLPWHSSGTKELSRRTLRFVHQSVYNEAAIGTKVFHIFFRDTSQMSTTATRFSCVLDGARQVGRKTRCQIILAARTKLPGWDQFATLDLSSTLNFAQKGTFYQADQSDLPQSGNKESSDNHPGVHSVNSACMQGGEASQKVCATETQLSQMRLSENHNHNPEICTGSQSRPQSEYGLMVDREESWPGRK